MNAAKTKGTIISNLEQKHSSGKRDIAAIGLRLYLKNEGKPAIELRD